MPQASPAPAGASPSAAEAWAHAVRWVDENRGLVVRNAEKRYAGFAPYDREDYVQEAYVAAFQALTDCGRAGTPERFVAHLFLRFRRECREEMGIRREAPSSLQPGDRELPADRYALSNRPRSPTTPEERAEAERRRELLWKALKWMTPRQQVAWLLALGHLGHGEADARDIARTLKISRRAAYGLLTRGQEQAEAAARREKGRIEQENSP
ncbi:MAG: sigma-70 family RNA polymerase sigma factor [Deferrisomatales bacterium]|nr:sigma-70 family RNA polymerase sigma factor [Deferrisomatales bacterium]